MTIRPPIPPKGRRTDRNLLLLAVRALFVGWRGNALTVVLQPFVLQLGASVAFLGLLETLGSYRGLVPTAVQPLSGWLADRWGRKRLIVAAGIITSVSLLVLALIGRWRVPALLVPAAVLLGLGGIGRPAADALVGESAGAQVGYAYSLISAAWAVAGIVALAAGFLAERLGYSPVFALTAGLEVLATLLLAVGVRETLVARRTVNLRLRDVWRLTGQLLVPPQNLRTLYAAVAVDSFAYGLGSVLLYGFLADRFGFNPLQFGIMTAIYSFFWVLAQLPAGRLADRGKARELLVLSELLSAVAIISWLLTSQFAIFAASMVVLGVATALWVPALMAWVYGRVPGARRGEELGRLNAVPGAFGFLAPWIGGILYTRLGFNVPIVLNLVGALLAGAILAWELRPRPEQEGRE